MIIDSYKEEDTFSFGEELGKKAVPGEIYALCGDLGVGKTVFTKGLAKGMGITESVCSPTFTIVQIYEEGRLPLYHFDVYRIGDPEEMDEIGYEAVSYTHLDRKHMSSVRALCVSRAGTIRWMQQVCIRNPMVQ